MREAEALPLEVSDRVADIAEAAIQSAFAEIARQMEALGFPVTGDFSPEEVAELSHAFQGYVLAMALNNERIGGMQNG